MFKRISLVVTVLMLAAALAQASDVYFDIPVRDLKIVEGELPKPNGQVNSLYPWPSYERDRLMRPYVVLDGPGEAYLPGPAINGELWSNNASGTLPPALTLRLRAPEGQEVKGRLVMPKTDRSGMVVLRFVVPTSAAKAEAKVPFYQAKLDYYSYQIGRDIPGGAWFRHQARLTRTELKMPDASSHTAQLRGTTSDPVAGAYDLFTGGRAISENLQLDRVMPPRAANETPVKVDSIAGITIKEIDWKPLIKDAQPAVDPLARKIPFDQHAVFFPSFQAAVAVADETKQHDTPVLRLAQPRAEDAGIVPRYERQLGLPMSTLARMLGPALVKSVALTGGDPSFPLGTDLTVLLETEQPEALAKVLTGRVALAAAGIRDAKPESGDVDGLKYRGFQSPDRKISSYLAAMDGCVVVTNSIYQLKRLAAVVNSRTKSLADLPEYMFFRMRYQRNDAAESALVFISDATIRRWCGPRWRIADSRRTRVRAVMAELQASQLKASTRRGQPPFVQSTLRAVPVNNDSPLFAEPGPIHTDLPILGGGEMRLTRDGVVSGDYGTLDFMTPVGEMPLDEVTQDEAQSYQAWRDGYQRNWSWGFDPIGLRICLGKENAAADLTIMPIILNSEYNQFFEISKGATFAPAAGDPHRSLLHFIMALNRDSSVFHQGEGMAMMFGATQKIPLGWVGPSLSLYADDDPFWDDLAKVDEKQFSDFMQKNLGRLPVALRVDSTNPLQLAAFLAAVRGYIEQTGPGLTQWESLKYKEQGYVRISAVKGQPGMSREIENAAVYYTTVGGALTVTLSEKVLKNAIDRGLSQAAKLKETSAANDASSAQKAGPISSALPQAWLGANAALRVDARILEIANSLGRQQYRDRMQILSWSNLPILNEWKRLFPDRDPVAVHAAVWGVTLVCPGGGKYVWNEKYGTMESTVYGHPGEPKDGPAAPPVLSSFTSADFGLTLENDGLRARVELHRPTKGGQNP